MVILISHFPPIPQGGKGALTSQSCDLGQITSPPCASVSSPLQWDNVKVSPEDECQAMRFFVTVLWFLRAIKLLFPVILTPLREDPGEE